MTDIQRKALLEALIIKNNSGKNVTDKELKAALTEEEWQTYLDKKHEPKPPAMPPYVAQAFKKYVDELKRADSLYRRADARSSRSRNFRRETESYIGLHPKKSLATQAEMAYEHALEILSESIDGDRGIVRWLDRWVNFDTPDGAPSANPEDMPRLGTSRSPYTLHEGRPKQSLRGFKLSLVMKSLDDLA